MELCDYNHCCVLIHGSLIFYEIADRLVDLFVANNYDDGNISDDPRGSVHTALMVFFVIGLHITIGNVVFYLGRIQLYFTGGSEEGETRLTINLWTSLAKVWLEAFPQATIAKFYFGNCASKDGIKTLVQAFDVFSIIPFIKFVGYMFCYCAGLEPNGPMKFILAATFILSILGIIFAGISINDFNDRCRPDN